jgi:hypothetical protein
MSQLLRSSAILLLASLAARGQTIIADNYDISKSGTGFALGSGVNVGINPPTTRLTGSAAAGLRYMATDATKAVANYSITGNKLQVASAANSGRVSLSANGTTAFDFAPALGIAAATALHPVVYDVTISMANSSAGIQRFSFALGTAENNANFWDFGIQLYRAVATDNFYQIGKRIDAVSLSTATDSTGSTGDLNAPITATAANSFGTQFDLLMRVTDAGAESTTFNSRVQLSLDAGTSWFYDTQSDASLPLGWRLDGASRYFMWDAAASAAVTYDNFSVTLVPEPSTLALGLAAGLAGLIWRRRQ